MRVAHRPDSDPPRLHEWPFFPDNDEPKGLPAHGAVSSNASTLPSPQQAFSPTKISWGFGTATPFIPGFLVESMVGQGSMATVFKAIQLDLNRRVALKCFTRIDSTTELRLRAEAEAIAQVEHPNIVPIYTMGKYRDYPYLVFEFCAGGSLAGYLKKNGPIPSPVAVAALLPIVSALEHVHQLGILHRDIKPANILLATKRRDSVYRPYLDMPDHKLLMQQLKLADFGMVRHPNHRDLNEGNLAGTPCYMPPEVANEEPHQDKRSDLYSIGVVLYEMLSGRPPFLESTIQQTLKAVRSCRVPSILLKNPHVPARLADICHQCMAKRPEDRYPSARELADDLLRFLNRKKVQARKHLLPGKTWLARVADYWFNSRIS